jgi:hypothetical protein
MAEKITPIETEVGFITGRDAIYLKDIIFIHDGEYCIKGMLNGYNCTLTDEDVDLPFSLTFKGVLLWRAVELDFAERELNIETDSCFDFIENSEKLTNIRAYNKGKIDRGYDKNGKYSDEVWHQHFILSTYDTVFEIIAQSYDLVIGKPETPVYISIEEALKLKK